MPTYQNISYLQERLTELHNEHGINIEEQQITRDLWHDKYKQENEQTISESMLRVCNGVYAMDEKKEEKDIMYKLMTSYLWNPGGRIHAGAGTPHTVTLMNCYVDRTIEDSMSGIADALRDAMLTMQQGGGIGMDFSTLRPSGAHLARTGAIASGPLPFMDTWDAMCKTIMSAGARRGAMMATICDTHPDLPLFITAKREQGRLTQFNVSVKVSDAFIDAVRSDEMWELYFHEPPHKAEDCLGTFIDEKNVTQHIYQRIRAIELWDMILQNTYEYAEPGVIFMDRVNDLNNLAYCEDIQCTNPCGEQPLPPNGCCNLGAVNLARLVRKPFTSNARMDWDLLEFVVRKGVRFLDNVIDVTNYPIEAQQQEEFNKRRLGLGVLGLHDAIMQLSMVYGESNSIHFTRTVFRAIAHAAYRASVELAIERGVFPMYLADKFIERPFIQKLDKSLQEEIKKYGVRNGVLLTIAPTGNTSIYYGNISGGVEPYFMHEYERRVLQRNGAHVTYVVNSYAASLYKKIKNQDIRGNDLGVTANGIDVGAHVRIQAAAQEWVDASISKTINCPEDLTYDEFRAVYDMAYDLGAKGCTTYRPSEIRGSVLSAVGSGGKEKQRGQEPSQKLPIRPDVLEGKTYKIKWPTMSSALYITINHDANGRPFEVFISSKNARNQEWMTALTLMVTSVLRLERSDITFIPEELMQVVSAHDHAYIDGKYFGSLVAYIGYIFREHLKACGFLADPDEGVVVTEKEILGAASTAVTVPEKQGEICPSCGSPTYYYAEGCKKCSMCLYSSC